MYQQRIFPVARLRSKRHRPLTFLWRANTLRKMGINVVLLHAAPSPFFKIYVAIHKQYVLSILLVSNGVSKFSLLRGAVELWGRFGRKLAYLS